MIYGNIVEYTSTLTINGVSSNVGMKELKARVSPEMEMPGAYYIALLFVGVAFIVLFITSLETFSKKINEYKFDIPIKIKGATLYIKFSKKYKAIKESDLLFENMDRLIMDVADTIFLKEREPIIRIVDEGENTVEYRLQTDKNEDFTNKYFQISIRLSLFSNAKVPVLQIDGFISDNENASEMTNENIGYRMEGYFLSCGGEEAEAIRKSIEGLDLTYKGLKYPGYTIPSNVRLIGICPHCKKPFAFHAYSIYMAQIDIAYSNDGQDVCQISDFDINKESWEYSEDGKVFRYYNSFSCPHCGTPYIDYKNHPEMKSFGVSGCVHLGKTSYNMQQLNQKEQDMNAPTDNTFEQESELKKNTYL